MKIKHFKNKILALALALAFIMISFAYVAPVFASSISVSTTGFAVKEGDVVKIAVIADGKGEPNYTFKSSVKFSPELLSVTDWKWSDVWIPVSFSEYESIDNGRGSIVRTAGYPGGITGEKEFGVITFTAKKSGYAVLSIDADNSFVLNVDNENTLK